MVLTINQTYKNGHWIIGISIYITHWCS